MDTNNTGMNSDGAMTPEEEPPRRNQNLSSKTNKAKRSKKKSKRRRSRSRSLSLSSDEGSTTRRRRKKAKRREAGSWSTKEISTQWHIPRPSLSSSGSCDSRSRGGSSSSQGSSSNHSTHSASSGSLLLNAAQLARTARHPKEECGLSPNRALPKHTNVVSIPEEPSDTFWSDVKRGSIAQKDATSIASSTHFTVVNGFTKPCSTKEPKTCCCDHSHQITVLVISMTILFSACILAAICFVEMRMRKETGIYKYS